MRALPTQVLCLTSSACCGSACPGVPVWAVRPTAARLLGGPVGPGTGHAACPVAAAPEPLDECHLVAGLVVLHLVDHPLRDHDPEPPVAQAELFADRQMGDGVFLGRRVGEAAGVEAG